MATLTASAATAGAPARFDGCGATWAMAFNYTATSTLSNGDVVLMGKIAHGTTVLDGYVVQTDGDTGLLSAGITASVVIARLRFANMFASLCASRLFATTTADVRTVWKSRNTAPSRCT